MPEFRLKEGTIGAKFIVCRRLRPMKFPAEIVSSLLKNGNLAADEFMDRTAATW